MPNLIPRKHKEFLNICDGDGKIFGFQKLKLDSSYQKSSFRSEIYKISYILELVIDGRSYENQIVGIELTLEALSLSGLIHFAFAEIDP